MRTELWYAVVEPNETLLVTVGDLKLLHLSGAALGEVKQEKCVKKVVIKVNNDGRSLVLGTLSSKVAPQIKFNLVFEHDFELSHGWKDGSVCFTGFVADISRGDELNNQSDENENENDAFDYAEHHGPFPLRGIPIPNEFLAPGQPREVKRPKEKKVSISGKRKEE